MSYLEFYKKNVTNSAKAIENAIIVDDILKHNFSFDYVECIETGVSNGLGDDNFGLYLGKFTEYFNGTMYSVDIDGERVDLSNKFIKSLIPNLTYESICKDSIEYLKEYDGRPNLVHLDSFDLDMFNPFPSMLHHWHEFLEIKDKMPIGSILMVDDNFFKNTKVSWHTFWNGEYVKTIDIIIPYEVIGKGTLIYQAVKSGKINDWKIIGEHYGEGPNLKIIFKKI